MLGVISGSAQGMTSLVYYVLIYMFANLAVFTVITIVALRAGKFLSLIHILCSLRFVPDGLSQRHYQGDRRDG